MSTRNQQHRRGPASAQTTTEDATTTTTTTTLRLRGEEEDVEENVQQPAPRRRIRWDESVVNNEGMGRKSSKGEKSSFYFTQHWMKLSTLWQRGLFINGWAVCCIYHKSRALGESSSEESSSSESSSDDTDSEDGHGTGRRRRPSNEHQHDASCSQHRHKGKGKRKPTTRNAYERTPKSNLKGSTKNAS